MDLYIKLKEGKTLKDAALGIQQLNEVMTPLLVNGPIKCNPEADQPELFLGDVNSPPNSAGIITIRIVNYDSLEIDPVAVAQYVPLLSSACIFVWGYPRRGEFEEVLPTQVV